MSVIESEVQRVMSLICAAPAASPGKRAAAQGVANDLLRQVDRLRGQDLGEFASAGLQLQGRCTASGSFRVGHGASTSGGGTIPGFEHLNLGPHEPIADYIFGEPGQSQWFDEVGISEREACDADREAEHFTQVDEVGGQIQACCQAIDEVCTTGDIAMQELLSPVSTMLEMIARMGFPHLTDQAIDVAIDALKQASATAKDRNCVIEECLDTIATCVEKIAEQQPQEPVEYAGGGGGVGAGAAATVAANAPETPAPKPAPEPAPPTGPKEFHETGPKEFHEPAPKPAPPAPAPEPPRLQEYPRFETRCVDTGVGTGTVSAAQAGTTAASADVLASAAAAASGAFEQAVSQAVQSSPVNMEVHFNFDLDGAINAGLEAVDCDTVAQFQPPAPEVNTAAWVGAMAQTGAAAVLEGLDCFAASLEAVAQCPGAECCTHGAVETVEVVEHPVPAPEPEPAPELTPEPDPVPAPAPDPAPEPAPAPQPQDGVIPPPPELAEVEEPEPPAEKLAHQPNPATETAQAPPEATGTGAAEPTVSDHTSEENTNHDEQAAADSNDPWAMKKTGEW